MAAAQGFTEVYNYSFVSEEMARAFDLDPAALVEVANPIASEQNLLRPSLLPGLWKNVRDNARNFDAFRLFEIGHEIHKQEEVPHFAAAIYAKDDGVAGLLELKRLAECLLPGISVRPAPAQKYEEKLQPETARYQPIRRFPTSAFDLSVVAPAHALIGDVQAAIPRSSEVVSIEFLREFALPDGRRSLSYRITLGAADRTLSSEEVGAVRSAMIAALTSQGYESRS